MLVLVLLLLLLLMLLLLLLLVLLVQLVLVLLLLLLHGPDGLWVWSLHLDPLARQDTRRYQNADAIPGVLHHELLARRDTSRDNDHKSCHKISRETKRVADRFDVAGFPAAGFDYNIAIAATTVQ